MYGSASYTDNNRDYYWRLSGKVRPTFPKRAIAVTAGLTACVWLVDISSGHAYDLGWLVGVGFLLAFAVMIGAEFYCVLITTHRVTSLITSHHWDLLRLTPMPSQRIFADLYVSIQLRCRKTAVVEITTRIVPVLLIVFGLIQEDLSIYLIFSVYFFWFLLFGLVLLIFVIEPHWRFYAILAANILIAARVKNFLFAALEGIGAISAIHILQLAIMVLPFWWLWSDTSASLGILCTLPFMVLLQIAASYWLLRQIRERALSMAQRALFRLE